MTSRKTVHLVGIGGIGMSGLARMYLSRGWAVQGSDLKKTDLLESLERLGARILIGHDAIHVQGADLVIYSSSIAADHPERRAAERHGIAVIHRAEALAEICRGKNTVAVTGTHGKTTTTALIGTVLKEAGRDPSIVVGGLVISFGGNALVGQGPDMVIEADESDSSFLKFSPAIEVITNIEEEHMDHFKTIDRIEKAYRDFIERLPADGLWIGCAEDARVRRLAAEKKRPCLLYGFERSADGLWASDIAECPGGERGIAFTAWNGEERLGPVRLKIIGRHNALNALAAIGAGLRLGVPFDAISRALGSYEGAGRRFDVRFEDRDFLVVDDYAHHPTEIQKTLAAAKALKRGRIFAVFQPHRYTRAQAFMKDFARSFADVDTLVVTDVYAASEKPITGVSGETMRAAIEAAGHRDATYVPRANVDLFVRDRLGPGDLFITLGAGDIYQSAYRAAEFLRAKKAAAAPPDFSGVKGKVLKNEPLSKHTSLKIGGPAAYWIEPEDAEDLKRAVKICRQNALPMRIFGAGSNILPPDGGLPGAVIHLSAPYWRVLRRDGDLIRARAGAQNTLFIQFALEQGFGGCEFLSGIPGNIGGAVAMNAGSHHRSVEEALESVDVLFFDGRAATLKKSEIPFRYRSSGLTDAVILEAAFRLPARDRSETQKILDEYREHRARTQDLLHPSAGCMFKNPENAACSSGKLIEDAGLKGRTVGRAQVSTKHANFIINLGGASAEDVQALIREVRDTVKKKFNVELETEVKIL